MGGGLCFKRGLYSVTLLFKIVLLPIGMVFHSFFMVRRWCLIFIKTLNSQATAFYFLTIKIFR